MASSRTKAVLFGQDARLAGGFLGAGVVGALLMATGIVQFPPSVWAIIAALVVLYAYWNDGLAACWLFTFVVLFGAMMYSYANVTGDIRYDPVESAFFMATFISAVAGPLSFLIGAGVREFALRAGAPGRLLPKSRVPLADVLLGGEYRAGIRPVVLSVGLAIVVGAGVVLVNPTFGPQPPSGFFNPLLLGLYSGIVVFAATIAWRYDGLLPPLGATFIVLLGLFGGFTFAPDGVIETGREALWYAFLLTLVFWVPGVVLGNFPRLHQERDDDMAVTN